MTVACKIVRLRLPGREEEPWEGWLGRHVESCLQYQAEQARYRKMRRQLAKLATIEYSAPQGLVAEVATQLGVDEPVGEEEAAQVSRTAVAAAAGAAVVAAGAAVIILRKARAA